MSIHDDCYKRICDRLDVWIRDSQQLYSIAELDDHTFHDVISALLSRYISGMMTMDYEEKRAMTIVFEAIRQSYADRRAGLFDR